MKELELTFNVRALDNLGVCASSDLETKNLDEAIITCLNLMNAQKQKWVIVATSEDERKEE